MIFLDTSAIYALADRDDPNHEAAKSAYERSRHEGYLTHNYILVESMALLQARLGARAAIELARSSSSVQLIWVDAGLHEGAVQALVESPRRRVSFVDRVSFEIMKREGVKRAFAFDEDFRTEGFELV